MAFIHGKGSVITIDDADLSAFTNNVVFNRTSDTHDVTTYGKNAHVFKSGLKNGTITISGVYDDGVAGPEAILSPLIGGDAVEVVWSPEGTGVGKPIRTVDVLVQTYDETSPVADMISWSATLQMTDVIVDSVGV